MGSITESSSASNEPTARASRRPPIHRGRLVQGKNWPSLARPARALRALEERLQPIRKLGQEAQWSGGKSRRGRSSNGRKRPAALQDGSRCRLSPHRPPQGRSRRRIRHGPQARPTRIPNAPVRRRLRRHRRESLRTPIRKASPRRHRRGRQIPRLCPRPHSAHAFNRSSVVSGQRGFFQCGLGPGTKVGRGPRLPAERKC
jgi:hypothetical protein